MKSITSCLKSLETTGFLRTKLVEDKGLQNFELLSLGKKYAEQLQYQWLNVRSTGAYIFPSIVTTINSHSLNHSNRLTFAYTQEFCSNLQQFREKFQGKCPGVIKFKQLNSSAVTNGLLTHTGTVTQLITDFFVNPRRGLEHFYNIQRESKIWWMRYSANPSRYYIEPYELNSELEGAAYTKHCQSITIKSRYSDGNATVEQLTLLPLHESLLVRQFDYQLLDERTAKLVTPTVIRSIIQLESAACALLLDGCDNERQQTLILNRKLAPYQCSVVCFHEKNNGSILANLQDLSLHLTYVLQRAGLRLASSQTQNKPYTLTKDILLDLQTTDKLGVPYTLIVDEQTLNTGLFKLRSRDTSLSETIHVSDIPEYLINIFSH